MKNLEKHLLNVLIANKIIYIGDVAKFATSSFFAILSLEMEGTSERG